MFGCKKMVSLLLAFAIFSGCTAFAQADAQRCSITVNGRTEQAIVYKGEEDIIQVEIQADFEPVRTRIYLDGTLKECVFGTAFGFDTRDVGCGDYELRIVAEDAEDGMYPADFALSVRQRTAETVFSEDYEKLERTDETTGTDILPQTDFSDGKLPSEMTQKTAGIVEIRETEFTDGKALYIQKDKGTSAEGGVLINIAPNNGGSIPDQYTATYRFYPVNCKDGTVNLSVNTPYVGAGLQLSGQYMIAKIDGMTAFQLAGPLQPQWYTVKLEVNSIAKTYRVSVDGERKPVAVEGTETYDIPFRNASVPASDIRFTIDTQNTAEFYIDDLRVYYDESKETLYTNGMQTGGLAETVEQEAGNGKGLAIFGGSYVRFPADCNEGEIAFSTEISRTDGSSVAFGSSDGSSFAEIAMLSELIPADGQRHLLTAELAGGLCRFLLDGGEIGTFSAETSFSSLYIMVQGEEKAIVDNTKIQKFHVKRLNDLPVLTASPYNEDTVEALDELEALTITAADEDGIARISLYADGVQIAESDTASLVYDLKQLGCGTHPLRITAFDVFGAEVIMEFILEITSGTEVTVFAADFEEGSLSGAGVSGFPQRGYVRIEPVDASRGKSLLAGIDSMPGASDGAPYVNFPLSAERTNYTIEFDYYISALSAPSISLRPVSGAETVVYLTEAGNISVNGGNIGKYEPGKWYRVRLDVDLIRSAYSLQFGDVIMDDIPMKTKGAALSYFRIYGSKNELKPGFAAVDNVHIATTVNVPEIVSVCDEKGNIDRIDPSARKLYLKLNGAIYGKTFDASKVSVQSVYEEPVEVDSADFDSETNSVTVSLAGALRDDTAYMVILSKDTELLDGVHFDIEVKAGFITSPVQVRVPDCTLESLRDASYARLTLENRSDEEAVVYAVISVWNGIQFVEKQVTEIQVSADTSNVVCEVFGPKCSGGQHAEVYVLDALCGGEVIYTSQQ